MTQPHIKAVLFDLDGTLIDHFQVIYRCYRYALQKLSLPPVSFQTVKSSVGGSIVITFGKLIPAQYVDDAVDLFREEFDRIWDQQIDVLPGAEALLNKLLLANIPCAVFTNKEGNRSRDIIKHLGWEHYFKTTIGTLDTAYRKPDPEFTEYALVKLKSDPAHTIMIGDSPYDLGAAQAGNLNAYLVATGSHSLEELQSTEAVAAYPSLIELSQDLFSNFPEPALN